MSWVYVEELGRHSGEIVKIRGWVHHRRSSGKIRFLEIRDGTGIVQCVLLKNQLSEQEFELADRMPLESSVLIEGEVRADKRAPGGYELTVNTLQLVHQAEEYPIQPKEHGIDFLLQKRHLWIRSPRQNAILRIRNELVKAIREFFDQRGFVLLDAPIFTPSACEGTSTLFKVDYFGEPAYLTQSGQLYMEAGAMALSKVYCFGPTFRAEKSKTRRHLTEFWMVEPEVAWYELEEVINLAEDLIIYFVERIIDKRKEELKILERHISLLEQIKKPFPKISYDQAIELLKNKGMNVQWGEDFGGDEETALSQSFAQPVIIHRYPAKVKAFYMANDPANPELALCVDILAPEGYGEIVGGGQREADYNRLLGKINAHNLPKQVFDWYLDLRKFGSVPHSGFGLGIERTLAWICKLKHIREAIPFPRMLEKIFP